MGNCTRSVIARVKDRDATRRHLHVAGFRNFGRRAPARRAFIDLDEGTSWNKFARTATSVISVDNAR